MKATSKARRLIVALAVLVGLLVGGGLPVQEAHAIIGRPLTPMSYAGVARRTTRRTVAATGVMVAAPIYW
jgi:hypothetical protein